VWRDASWAALGLVSTMGTALEGVRAGAAGAGFEPQGGRAGRGRPGLSVRVKRGVCGSCCSSCEILLK